MLLQFDIAAGNFVRSLYPELYSDDETQNRVLTSSDEKRLLELAVAGPVIQLYGPAYRRGVYRYVFDIAAPTPDEVLRLADRAFEALKPSIRQPPPFEDPEFVPLKGTQHARQQISFASTDP